MSTTHVVEPVATLGDDVLHAIYAQYAAPLLRYVQQLTGDRHRAEDVVQEAMLRAWQHPQAASPERGSLRPWLWVVARHIVIDQARARKSRPAEVTTLPHLISTTDDGLDRYLLAIDVATAINTLSPAHRDVLREVYYRDRSIAEAAKVLGVPIGTVKSRTYYALQTLKLALQERARV